VRLLRLLAGWAVGASGLAAAELETIEEDLIRLRTLQEYRLQLRPGGNIAYLDDRLVVHPKGLIGVGADSNVRAETADRDRDVFGVAIVGVDSRFQVTARDRLRLDSELVAQRYLREGDARVVGGGANGVATHIDNVWRLDLSAGARRIDEPVVLTAEPVTRDEADAGLKLLLAGRTTSATVALSADTVDWREDNREFNGQERDAHGARIGLGLQREFGRAAAIHLDGVIDRREYRNPGRYQDSVGWEVGVGGQIATGQRSRANAGAGWIRREYADDFANDQAYDDAVVAVPAGRIGWGWEWEKRSFITVGLARTLYDGIDSNATHVTEGQSKLRYRLAWESAVEFGLRNRWLSDSGTAANRTDHRRTITDVSVSFEHVVTSGMVVRWLNQATWRRSNLDDEFDRYVSTLEVGVAW